MMKKENIPLIVGLAVPVVMILVLAAVIYAPRAYVEPEYDFVYAVGRYPVYVDYEENVRVEYRVVDGELVKEETQYSDAEANSLRPGPRGISTPEFYRYDVSADENVPLSEEEVMELSLDSSQEAPDGFEVTYSRSNDNIFEAFFGGRNHEDRVLEKGSVTIDINLIAEGDIYRSDFSLVGWVTE